MKRVRGMLTETSRKSLFTLLRPYSVKAIVLFGALIFAIPYYYMTISSTFATEQFFFFPPRLIPGPNLVENYTTLLFETRFARTLLNSVIFASLSTIGIVSTGTLAGYAFAKFSFPGRKPLFYLTLSTLAFPFQLIAIPLFELLVSFRLVDTWAGLVLPTLSGPIGVFFMKQNIEANIVDSLLKSARIDGASEFQTFYHIVLPLLKPGMAALGVLMFFRRIQGLFWPLIAVRSPSKQVATVFIENLSGGAISPNIWTQMMPALVLATFPALILFIFVQDYFIKGMVGGHAKG
jgi:ABC-type glycerol-3-phosphate transport system permease component